MHNAAIRVENLGKLYRIAPSRHPHSNLREAMTRVLQKPFRLVSNILRQQPNVSQPPVRFWALKDVSLHVQPGEVVGIIGPNGSGKTTLLKILARITEPTEGRVEICGRTGSLLEVGTGFHYELTGHENIFLNGAILGMKRKEIRQRLDEIVAFAGVEKFLETPLKHYSTGMAARLAFAVAAHLEAEILLIDEVLAVGDVAFRRKCLEKMEDVARTGRTVLFVSHDLSAISSLSTKIVLLRRGRIETEGKADDVVSLYLSGNLEDGSLADRKDRRGSGTSKFTGLQIVSEKDAAGRPVVFSGQPVSFMLDLRSAEYKALDHLSIWITLSTSDGRPLFTVQSPSDGEIFRRFGPHKKFECHLPCLPLVAGVYSLGLACFENGVEADVFDNAMTLIVKDQDLTSADPVSAFSLESEKRKGSIHVEHSWRTAGIPPRSTIDQAGNRDPKI